MYIYLLLHIINLVTNIPFSSTSNIYFSLNIFFFKSLIFLVLNFFKKVEENINSGSDKVSSGNLEKHRVVSSESSDSTHSSDVSSDSFAFPK